MIDQLVYELYELTPEEIAIVEESVGQRAEARDQKSEGRGRKKKRSRKGEAELPPSLPGWD